MKEETSSYLGLLKKVGKIKGPITDGERKINTIKIGKPKIPNYSKPKIIYDIFSSSQEEMAPDIKKTGYIEMVRELGFEIVSEKVSDSERWFPYQSVKYNLKRGGLIAGQANILETMPSKHYLEVDRANKRVRLRGPNCKTKFNRCGRTDWESFE